jgi:tetratricopeptide (TPR) repeat protein
MTAVVVRLLYLTEHAASPLFTFPVLDGLYYDTVARQLLAGASVAEIDPGFRPLLYPWLLSRLYAVGGAWGRELAGALQHLLGVSTALLTAVTSWRLGASTACAAAAGILFSLAGPPLYFEGELLNTTLVTFLLALFVALFVALDATAGRWSAWAGAGVLLGLAAQARPNALVVAPVLLFPLLRRRGVARPLVAVATLLVTLLLFAAWQARHFGSFQLLTSSGGVNLYLGNKRGADGMIPRQDRAVTYGERYRDSVEVFARSEAEAHRPPGAPPLSPAAISRYWTGRAFDEVTQDPLAWAGLVLRKVWLLIWNAEIPSNKTYAFVATEESRLLAFLPVRWWMLLALAPLGIAAIAERRDARPGLVRLVAVVALWSLTVVLFFVNGRYRIPLWPPLCVLAASGGAFVWRGAQARRFRRLAPPAAAGAALAVLSLGNWLDVPPFPFDRDVFYRSLAHLDRGELDAAAADARRAMAMRPDEAVYVYQVGDVALAADRDAEAAEAFRTAAALEPGEPRIWNGLGVALEGQDRGAEAYQHYLHAIALVPDFAPALTNAALLELRAGLVERAARHVEAAARGGGEPTAALLCARAFLERARGRDVEAARFLERARDEDPDLTERLAAEHERRLTPAQLGLEVQP